MGNNFTFANLLPVFGNSKLAADFIQLSNSMPTQYERVASVAVIFATGAAVPVIYPQLRIHPYQNGSNFITSEDNFVGDVWQSPGNISEQEKIEIIKTGFQLQAEDKIFLKKYYESKEESSVFQSKEYSIKYESIQKDMSFQNYLKI